MTRRALPSVFGSVGIPQFYEPFFLGDICLHIWMRRHAPNPREREHEELYSVAAYRNGEMLHDLDAQLNARVRAALGVRRAMAFARHEFTVSQLALMLAALSDHASESADEEPEKARDAPNAQ